MNGRGGQMLGIFLSIQAAFILFPALLVVTAFHLLALAFVYSGHLILHYLTNPSLDWFINLRDRFHEKYLSD